MANFRVNLDEPNIRSSGAQQRPPKLAYEGVSEPSRRAKKAYVVVSLVVVGIVLAVAAGLFIYYQTLKSTPQYSLALLVDAAARDDHAAIDSLIDVGDVVDDFMPQVIDKAVELYGRGQPPQVIERAKRLALPLLPAVKERAKAELPRVIRERTSEFGNVPFFAMAMGADRYLDIAVDGDTATIKSKIPDRPLDLTMRRNGQRWQIVGVREETVATNIARKIGQEIMAIAASGNKAAAEKYGMGTLSNLIREAEELVK